MAIEADVAARLSNIARLKACRELPQYPAAQEEWFSAGDIQISKQGLSALIRDTVSSDDGKTYVLEMLRECGPAPGLFRNTAAIFFIAASEGDAQFFRDVTLAMRAGARRKQVVASTQLAWCIVTHWFAGLLWLMDAEAGSKALQQYLRIEHPNAVVSEAAYRRACSRLRLEGYKNFAQNPPVLGYYPRQAASYGYDKGWRTRLEPDLRDD